MIFRNILCSLEKYIGLSKSTIFCGVLYATVPGIEGTEMQVFSHLKLSWSLMLKISSFKFFSTQI